jgi:gliding motility-associated-like protein
MNINAHHESYNGILLLDDLKINKLPGLDTIKSYTVAYMGDGKTILNASGGTSYSWLPEINLSAYNVQSPIMNSYSEKYTVAVGSLTTCSFMENFNISFDCNNLYPDKIFYTKDVFYYKNKNVRLSALEGKKYLWQPKEKVSEDTIRSPFISSYDTVFLVTIWDKYNCMFNEKFNLIINCDSLYPEKLFVTLDTTIKEGSTVKLITKSGTIDSRWKPSRWLNCSDCLEPLATAKNSITYQVSLKDDFGCDHIEAFNLNLELFVPNVITPNNDGYNDCFSIAGLPENSSLNIFNKAGLLIFSANPYNESNCWKGTDMNGNMLSSGTYWYVLDNQELKLNKKGFVFLKR